MSDRLWKKGATGKEVHDTIQSNFNDVNIKYSSLENDFSELEENFSKYVSQNTSDLEFDTLISYNQVNSWWSNPRCLLKNDILYSTGSSAQGDIELSIFDLKNNQVKKIRVDKYNTPDDHNTPAILIEDDLPPIMAWTSHGKLSEVRYIVGDKINDADSLADKRINILSFDNLCTYVSFIRKPNDNKIALITRSGNRLAYRIMTYNSNSKSFDISRQYYLTREYYYGTFASKPYINEDGHHILNYLLAPHPITGNKTLITFKINLDTGKLYRGYNDEIISNNFWEGTNAFGIYDDSSGNDKSNPGCGYSYFLYNRDSYLSVRGLDISADGNVLAMSISLFWHFEYETLDGTIVQEPYYTAANSLSTASENNKPIINNNIIITDESIENLKRYTIYQDSSQVYFIKNNNGERVNIKTPSFDGNNNIVSPKYSAQSIPDKSICTYFTFNINNLTSNAIPEGLKVTTAGKSVGYEQSFYVGGATFINSKGNQIILAKEKDGVWFIEYYKLVESEWSKINNIKITDTGKRLGRPMSPIENICTFVEYDYYEKEGYNNFFGNQITMKY